MLLDVKSGSTWWYGPNEFSLLGLPNSNCSTNPRPFHTSSYFVAQLLDGSETPTHIVESENTRTFNLMKFAAASLSNVILDHRNVFRYCKICMLYASLAIDQCFHLSLHKLYQILRPWEVSIQCHPS